MVDPPDLPVNWELFLHKSSNLPGVCNNANLADLSDLDITVEE